MDPHVNGAGRAGRRMLGHIDECFLDDAYGCFAAGTGQIGIPVQVQLADDLESLCTHPFDQGMQRLGQLRPGSRRGTGVHRWLSFPTQHPEQRPQLGEGRSRVLVDLCQRTPQHLGIFGVAATRTLQRHQRQLVRDDIVQLSSNGQSLFVPDFLGVLLHLTDSAPRAQQVQHHDAI